MILKEAWYKEALEQELQRAIEGLPSQDAFEALKKLYLRAGHLPKDVKEHLHGWSLQRVNSGSYDVLDLAVVWTASDTIPDIPVEAVFKTPPEYLPQVEFTLSNYALTFDLSNLPPPSDPFVGMHATLGLVVQQAVRMWRTGDQTDATPQHREVIRRLERAVGEASDPDRGTASLPLNEVLKTMGGQEGEWGKWYPEGSGSYRRSQKGQPLEDGGLGDYLPAHVGESQVVWRTQYANVVLESRTLEDQLMDLFSTNFTKPAGIYKPLRRWLHEMNVLGYGY